MNFWHLFIVIKINIVKIGKNMAFIQCNINKYIQSIPKNQIHLLNDIIYKNSLKFHI